MASTNPDSMTNAQGEFQPSRPRDQPMETSGHQPGRLVGDDAAPEFHAKVLPAGSAPASKTFDPNPVNEVPGQADNKFAGPMSGKETTRTGALDMPGATSADVHIGHGHPGSGQTSAETHRGGAQHSKGPGAAGIGGQDTGGSGLTGDLNNEARRLLKEHESGPITARQHNVSLDGAESVEPVSAEQLASENRKVQQHGYDRTAEAPPGKHS